MWTHTLTAGGGICLYLNGHLFSTIHPNKDATYIENLVSSLKHVCDLASDHVGVIDDGKFIQLLAKVAAHVDCEIHHRNH